MEIIETRFKDEEGLYRCKVVVATSAATTDDVAVIRTDYLPEVGVTLRIDGISYKVTAIGIVVRTGMTLIFTEKTKC